MLGEQDTKLDAEAYPFVSYIPCEDVIAMDEDPLVAVRRKKKSSMHLGMKALKDSQIDALISMGNTGALMACARIHLKTLPHITRPALLTLVPSKGRETALLDVGASSGAKSSHFLQFAAMGIAYQKARGTENPKAGLLNIGSEAIKGPPELQKAYRALASLYEHFQGNIEARNAFDGLVDVLITDGFTGNILLKASEGIARFLLEELSDHCDFTSLKKKLDYSEYPGALLAGVQGLVIKCHGTGEPTALATSIENALTLIEKRFLQQLQKQLHLFFCKKEAL